MATLCFFFFFSSSGGKTLWWDETSFITNQSRWCRGQCDPCSQRHQAHHLRKNSPRRKKYSSHWSWNYLEGVISRLATSQMQCINWCFEVVPDYSNTNPSTPVQRFSPKSWGTHDAAQLSCRIATARLILYRHQPDLKSGDSVSIM